MSIEAILERIAVALEARVGAAAPAAAPAAAKTTTAPKTETKPKVTKPTHTREELSAIAGIYRDKTDKDQAKAFISEKGGVAKLAELPEGKIDALYTAFESAIAELEAAEQSAGENDEM